MHASCATLEKKKKTRIGAASWYRRVADDSRIPKMPVITPQNALVHPQTQKKKNLPGLSCKYATPTFQKLPFWQIYSQIWNCGFFSIVEFMSWSAPRACAQAWRNWQFLIFQFQQSKFAVLLLGFEKWGL
jgi:hypothetical protein